MRRHLSILAGVLVLAPTLSGQAPIPWAPADDRSASPEEVRTLIDRLIANQRRNDAALEQYERREHRILRKSEKDKDASEDKTFRVVPTGTGTLRLLVRDKDQPVALVFYRQELSDLERAVEQTLNPNAPGQKQRVEKWLKRTKERAELVDAVRDAFRFTWAGRETRDGRTLIKLDIAPNPAFKARTRSAELFAHVHAIAWVEEAAAQLARVEAEVIYDISFGGGLLGKVYRGGRFVMEQQEVAPGVWLPSRYAYDFAGRRFLFGFEVHELTEASHYRYIGPPRDALATVRRELTVGQTYNCDP